MTFPEGQEPVRAEALHRAQRLGLVTWHGGGSPSGDMDTVRLTRAAWLALGVEPPPSTGRRLLAWGLRVWRRA